MLIETTRLIVRPFREKDADTLYRINGQVYHTVRRTL